MPPGLFRAAARLLLLALTVTTLGPVLHGIHDEELQPLVVHDESRHHFQAASSQGSSTAESDHCVACHFVRTSRGPVSWELTGLHVFTPGKLLFHSDGELVAPPSASPTPARAPPTLA
jgi:hypothetical protein